MKIIDATDCIAGRLASIVAKNLLKGERISIVNAEKAVVTGNHQYIIQTFTNKIRRGDPYHGPFYPKKPDKILRRMVRGMLPYKKPRGRQAFKNLKVYISVPDKFKNKELGCIEVAKKTSDIKFLTLGEISERLGVKKIW